MTIICFYLDYYYIYLDQSLDHFLKSCLFHKSLMRNNRTFIDFQINFNAENAILFLKSPILTSGIERIHPKKLIYPQQQK